jgi:transposase
MERRRQWRTWREEIHAGRLIFIDETWAKTNMVRQYGRARRGERVIDHSPHGHWQTTTLIAALDVDGIRCSAVIDGPVNRDAFEAFVQQILVPVLRPGDVVVMDNLSSHKGAQVQLLIEQAAAHVRYLPPYSPDLNPIELVFSKMKQMLRSLGSRTQEVLWHSMKSVIQAITPRDASNCFAHAGYSLHVH